MKNYTEVTLKVTLPTDMAHQAATINREEPEFFSNVARLALTRRAIYRGIRDRQRAQEAGA